MTSAGEGRLVVVGTPIGNLDDLSPRAGQALRAATVIFCEDTRRTRKLLSALAIPTPRLVRLDQHNEMAMVAAVLAQVTQGAVAVVVTDAGMPTISDPGHLVVAAAAAAGFDVDVVPGPCAVSAALALSGLPASEYRFTGFLPRKGRQRAEALRTIGDETVTCVVYESPHRVVRTVHDLVAVCGPDRAIALAREITKLHQEVWRGDLGGAAAWLDNHTEAPRGEWVLVVGGRPASRVQGEATSADVEAALVVKLAQGIERRQAVAEVAAELAVPKRQVYAVALALKDS